MSAYSALTTIYGAAAATTLGASMERLAPAPVGVGVFEIEDGSGRWEVGGHFAAPPDQAGLALLAAIHGAEPFAVSRIEDRDWVAQVRRELHPIDVGRFTIHGDHDRGRTGLNRIGLNIEAAMAFGTGHHGTTRGCLVLLERAIRRGARPRRAVDIGCGTGVLAMAVARALRVSVWASDVDPVATATAAANVAANGARCRVRVARASGFRHAALRAGAPYDLVLANILARPLKRLAPEMARHLAPGGQAILSGIMIHQAAGVEAVCREVGLIGTDRVELDGWVSLALTRRAHLPGRRGAPKHRGRARPGAAPAMPSPAIRAGWRGRACRARRLCRGRCRRAGPA